MNSLLVQRFTIHYKSFVSYFVCFVLCIKFVLALSFSSRFTTIYN